LRYTHTPHLFIALLQTEVLSTHVEFSFLRPTAKISNLFTNANDAKICN